MTFFLLRDVGKSQILMFQKGIEKSHDTVDGSEIRRTNQLRLAVYPIVYSPGFLYPQRWKNIIASTVLGCPFWYLGND